VVQVDLEDGFSDLRSLPKCPWPPVHRRCNVLDASPAVHRSLEAFLEQQQLQRVWMASLEQRFLMPFFERRGRGGSFVSQSKQDGVEASCKLQAASCKLQAPASLRLMRLLVHAFSFDALRPCIAGA
jgi:hypothetical protein